MALRVLLADESSTIKRVIQLSLQDFAVEIKSVNLGIDVVEVAKKFQPDIVFADVLLQKRNGYEVTKEIKSCPELNHIPTVLMWSGFIDLDEDKYKDCGADDRLEKPFDAEKLRSLVRQYVPKTSQQSLSKFLNYPKVEEEKAPETTNILEEHDLELEEVPGFSQSAQDAENVETRATVPMPRKNFESPPPAKEMKTGSWNMDSFDDLPDLQEIMPDLDSLELEASPIPADLTSAPTIHELAPKPAPLNRNPGPSVIDPFESDLDMPLSTEVAVDDDDAWAHKDLTHFKIDDADDLGEPAVDYELDDSPVDEANFLQAKNDSPKIRAQVETPTPSNSQATLAKVAAQAAAAFDEEEVTANSASLSFSASYSDRMSAGEVTDDLEEISPLGFEDDDDSEVSEAVIHSEFSADPPSQRPQSNLTHEDIAAIVRAESRAIIETIARQVIPDLAERLIREELDRLLTEKEAQP